jgi:NAD+ synthase (glutamine-hydrolysing)
VKIALAQLDTRVGAIDDNADQLIRALGRARDELGCDLVVFPELAVSGYPPEDLLLHHGLRLRVAAAFARIAAAVDGIAACFGYPEYDGDFLYNSAAIVRGGETIAYRKWELPNYGVFDEKRYFAPGDRPAVVEIAGVRCGFLVCEDAWEPDAAAAAAAAGAEIVIVINGSPFHTEQRAIRRRIIAARVRETGLPFVYVNMVGGQDELVFDGDSFAMDATGCVVFEAPVFEAGLFVLEIDASGAKPAIVPQPLPASGPVVENVYRALVLGTRDYIAKNGFPGVALGLSGGVDSALTLCLAVDAIGAERVHAVMMPSRYTSDISVEDAAAQAGMLGVKHDVLPIEGVYGAVLDVLADLFAGLPHDTTEENVQARCRGILLMAISNKLGSMLLSTGNKSEMAVGYATLYGDMAGGFAPLKDCTKTLVYELARYRNGVSAAIPERVITRAPSAELAPDQKDSDSLPPYDVLDAILQAFILEDKSVEQITELGFDKATVGRVLAMVKRAEYKRRQAPPGVRISKRAFGRDWRYPITSGY